MKIVNFTDNLSPATPVVVTIGNFDGVHWGHQALIQAVVAQAKVRNCSSALVTFDPHPQEVLHPDKQVEKICTPELKERLLAEAGLDTVHIIPFTRLLSQLSPQDFALHFLIERFNLAKVVIGYDFRFGQHRGGDFKLLEQMSHDYHFSLQEVPPVQVNGQTVSSTLIRGLIREFRFAEIPPYLGRRYSIYGPVVRGDQRGRQLGFPTANLQPKVALPLPYGVYVTEVGVKDKRYYGVTNVGVRPTFGQNDPTVETWIFDFTADLYGEMMEVWPLKQLRSERKFPNIEALKQQIAQDIVAARKYLHERETL